MRNGECINDSDGDGVCDEFEIPGCTDVEACNYSVLATDTDNNCVYADAARLQLRWQRVCLVDEDRDGVCDSEDPCVGELDACNFDASATMTMAEIYECGCCGISRQEIATALCWKPA